MEIYIEKDDPYLRVKKIIAISMIAGIITSVLGFRAESSIKPTQISELATIQENSLIAVSDPTGPLKVKKIKVVITAYSSTTWQTDDSPFITASGKLVAEGIVANNMLPFGTEIRIPELYGDKVFVVEDRMHWKKGYYHIDIWFPDYCLAKDFGAKTTYIEILEN